MPLILVLAAMAALLAGCGPAAHGSHGGRDRWSQTAPDVEGDRGVRPARHMLAEAFWADVPDCVLVLPAPAPDGPSGTVFGREIERASARHLSERFERVIGPEERERLAAALVLDPDDPAERSRLAALTGCRHGLLVRPGGGVGWALVWTEARVSVELALIRLRSGRALWRGAAMARRGSGGVPLSPVSLLLSAGAAAGLAGDAELLPSLADAAVRRAMAGLPGLRGVGAGSGSARLPLR